MCIRDDFKFQFFNSFAENKIVFSFDGTKNINGDFFNQTESTFFAHDGVQMTQYENEPFIVGHYNHSQVEFMHLFHEKWYIASTFYDNPKRPIFGFAAVSRPGKVFILGGSSKHASSVSIFENHEWKQNYRQLSEKRINFLTITFGTDVMIFGGTTETS